LSVDNKFRVSCVQWGGEQKSQGPGPSDSDCSSASQFGSNLREVAVLYFGDRAEFGCGEQGTMGARIEELQTWESK
jgi:hypothetical protein